MNKFANTRIEFHILQSFPVSCLNRDDVGAPKSAVIGGVERARVSSQCWKRAVRTELHNMGIQTADRTKLVAKKIAEKCVMLGATEEEGLECGRAVAAMFAKSVKKDESDTQFFISNAEAVSWAKACERIDDKGKKSFSPLPQKEMEKILKNNPNCEMNLDIALFGRMVAKVSELNVEAAASFAHAISTHKAVAEIDFFTAVDDLQGPTHLGTLEFNSATYYRYISLDLGQLAANLRTEELDEAVQAFTKALFVAHPAARQTTMAALCPWNYAIVTVRKGQGLQIPFNTPVRPVKGEDMVSASIEQLKKRFADIERMYGSLFGLKSKNEISMESGSIDTLLAALSEQLRSL